MPKFLFIQCSLREGKKDGVPMSGKKYYHHELLLTVIEAPNAPEVAAAMGMTIKSTIVRSKTGLPTIHCTSEQERKNRVMADFFFFIREPEESDDRHFPNFAECMKYAITVPKPARKSKVA